jgi:hypothetical protein
MKKYFFTITILFFTSLSIAQDYKIAADTVNGEPLILGYFPKSVLENDTSFSCWWKNEYNNYQLDSSTIDSLEGKLENISIKIVLRTTCSDSREQVPRFFKLLDGLSFPKGNVTLIGVNREKKGLVNEADELQIEFVPTFIFYKNGKELGRIVETPVESLEKDLLIIVNKNH